MSATPPDPMEAAFLVAFPYASKDPRTGEWFREDGSMFDGFTEGYRAGLARAEEKAREIARRAREQPATLPFECEDLEVAALTADVIAFGIAGLALSPPSSSPPAPEEREEA